MAALSQRGFDQVVSDRLCVPRRASVLISVAALGLATLGIALATARADDGPCDQLRFRVAAIEAKGAGAGGPRRWDSIYTLQYDVGARARLLGALTAEGCT